MLTRSRGHGQIPVPSRVPLELVRDERCRAAPDLAHRLLHAVADVLYRDLVVAIDPVAPIAPVHLDVAERWVPDGESSAEHAAFDRGRAAEVPSQCGVGP